MATYWENSCSFGLRYVSWYKYLIVSLVFSHLGFWSGNLFLIAPFPDLCLLVPFYLNRYSHMKNNYTWRRIKIGKCQKLYTVLSDLLYTYELIIQTRVHLYYAKSKFDKLREDGNDQEKTQLERNSYSINRELIPQT